MMSILLNFCMAPMSEVLIYSVPASHLVHKVTNSDKIPKQSQAILSSICMYGIITIPACQTFITTQSLSGRFVQLQKMEYICKILFAYNCNHRPNLLETLIMHSRCPKV